MPEPIFKKRVPDFKKQPESSKTLEKDSTLFIKAKNQEERYGGYGGAQGLYNKTTKSGNEKKYFLAKHNEIEYLIMEVLCQLGLNTPTTRFLIETTDYKTHKKLVATRGFDGYIPMTALLDLFYFRNEAPPKALQTINKRYRLNAQSQAITDLQTGQEYKISGNLFASNIAGLFTQDTDFQPEGLNFGAIKRGNRFFCVLIDKDMSIIDGALTERILKTITQDLIRSKIFQAALYDQKLSIIDEISKLIEKRENSSILEQIFLSERVLNSNLSYNTTLHQMVDNLKTTGESIISFFTKDDPSVLTAYRRREGIRAAIADKVIEVIMLVTAQPGSLDKEALKTIIIEDLRAPYYQPFFKLDQQITSVDIDNSTLINAIAQDQIQELVTLELIPKDEIKKSLATNIFAVSEKFFRDFKVYIHTLLEQSGVKFSLNLKKNLTDLLCSIENDEFLFEDSPVDIKYIICEMDKILSKQSVIDFWKSHQSPSATWFNFKKEHARTLELVYLADGIVSSFEEVVQASPLT